MAKSKPIGVRIADDLFSNVMRVAAPLGLSLSKLVEKLLLFFIRYPREIIEFENRDPLQEELIELYQKPEWSLRSIKEKGILTRGQLYWIADLIQKAWDRAGSATSAWVIETVRAIEVLISRPDAGSEIINHIESSFPEQGQNIREKIGKSLSRLEGTRRIDRHYADAVARCFLFAVRDRGFDIPADVLVTLNKFLMPWCCWVGKRAITTEPFPKEVDTSPLLKQTASGFLEKHIVIEKQNVLTEVFLSFEGMGPFHVGEQPFSCGFSISEGDHSKVTFACNSQALYELIETVTQLGGSKEIVKFGHWEIMKNDKEAVFSVKKNGVLVFLKKAELEEFVDAIKELYGREDVQQDLLKEYVEIYGAV